MEEERTDPFGTSYCWDIHWIEIPFLEQTPIQTRASVEPLGGLLLSPRRKGSSFGPYKWE